MAVWWMFDNHTFKRIYEKSDVWECATKDPCGSLFVRADGATGGCIDDLTVHGHGSEGFRTFCRTLEERWPDIKRFLNEQ